MNDLNFKGICYEITKLVGVSFENRSCMNTLMLQELSNNGGK